MFVPDDIIGVIYLVLGEVDDLMEFHNKDLRSIETPVQAETLEWMLAESDYPAEESRFLVQGCREGFDLEYSGPVNRQDTSRNLPFNVGDRTDMWQKIMKEIKNKHYARPFEKIPFSNFVQSPVGLVPKLGDQTRLIFHLSYDFPNSGNKSVNYYTLREKCTVRYNDLDQAVLNSLRLLKLAKNTVKDETIWYRKTDIKSAFRLLPLKFAMYCLMILMACHPQTGQKYYFIDKCLPFGHSISCALFQ